MSQDERPTVMVTSPGMAAMLGRLEDHGWRAAKAWELTDEERLAVRASIGAGEHAMKPEFLSTLPNLRLIACISAGYDGVDVDWCRARGIEVTHAKGINAEDVADHAIGLMIAGWRNIALGDRTLRAGKWREGVGSRPSPAPRSAWRSDGGAPTRSRRRSGRAPRACWRSPTGATS